MTTTADPAAFNALRARIQTAYHEQRHADAARHSEARAGGNAYRRLFNDAQTLRRGPAGRTTGHRVNADDLASIDRAARAPRESAAQQTEGRNR